MRGENIQDYLQRHYIKYVLKVATKLNDLPHVIGYGVMNEPNMGWIGIEDLSAYKWELQLGPCCSPLQSLAISAGMPQNVMVYDHGMLGFKNTGPAVVNPHGLRPWRDNMPCVWEANGVVRVRDGKLELLRPHHFARQRGRTINFYTDYFIPFAKRFSQAVHDVQPEVPPLVPAAACGTSMSGGSVPDKSRAVGSRTICIGMGFTESISRPAPPLTPISRQAIVGAHDARAQNRFAPRRRRCDSDETLCSAEWLMNGPVH